MSTKSEPESDRITLDYSKRKHSGGSHGTGTAEISRDELRLHTGGELERQLKNIVGPSFLFCGVYGFMLGLAQSARDLGKFKNRPKKLIFTSVLNNVGRHSSKYANAGAALGLWYCISRRMVNFLFDEEIKDLKDIEKQAVWGFVAGAMFKSTRGILPAMLTGTICASFCSGMSYLSNKYKFI